MHRDLFFKGKPFPYVKQTNVLWKVIGPFDHTGEIDTKFPVEETFE